MRIMKENVRGVGLKVAEMLLNRDSVDVDGHDADKRTPLFSAVEGDFLDLVKLLIHHKANVFQKDSIGSSPLTLAAGSTGPNQNKIIAIFLATGCFFWLVFF